MCSPSSKEREGKSGNEGEGEGGESALGEGREGGEGGRARRCEAVGRGWGTMSGGGGVVKVGSVGRERMLVDERCLCRFMHNLDGLKPAQERKVVNISQFHTSTIP